MRCDGAMVRCDAMRCDAMCVPTSVRRRRRRRRRRFFNHTSCVASRSTYRRRRRRRRRVSSSSCVVVVRCIHTRVWRGRGHGLNPKGLVGTCPVSPMRPTRPMRWRRSSVRCRVTSVLSSYVNYMVLVKDLPGSPPNGGSSAYHMLYVHVVARSRSSARA